jgi:hypothetical protein
LAPASFGGGPEVDRRRSLLLQFPPENRERWLDDRIEELNAYIKRVPPT